MKSPFLVISVATEAHMSLHIYIIRMHLVLSKYCNSSHFMILSHFKDSKRTQGYVELGLSPMILGCFGNVSVFCLIMGVS